MQPLIELLPGWLSGPQILETIDSGASAYLLESGMNHTRQGRYSFIGADPFLIFASHGERCCLWEPGRTARFIKSSPFRLLRQIMAPFLSEPAGGFPMSRGGAVGYFGYDMGRLIEKLPGRAADDLAIAQCQFAFYDAGVVIDHLEQQAYLVSTGLPLTGPAAGRRAAERLENWRRLLQKGACFPKTERAGGSRRLGSDLSSNFTRQEYCRTVEKALNYIASGDIYQVNLSQRFTARLESHPWELYRRLCRLNPAPFAAYLRFPGVTVASSSPERFLLLEGDRVETRPIKGTRPRGSTPREDRALKEELLASSKDRAELVMIVDLERNDLGRVCRTGTVRVPELFCLEEYATVYHLVSTVTGRLEEGKDIFDLLKAAFPGGSITGAPKIRSMEIIEELEPVRRQLYTGSIGYLDFSGRSDLNIVIRTFILHGGRAYFQVGGGIVADSEPALEYRETLDKARALLAALGLEGGRIKLWSGFAT